MKLIAALALGLTTWAANAQADTLRIALASDIRGTNPGVNRDDPTDIVTLHMAEGLVAYREGGTVGPMLAQSVTMSPDGRTYTFKLRPGIKFHNGALLTAADVVWSWNRYLDPKTEWRCLQDLTSPKQLQVERVVATADDTVEITINKPNALFLDTIARPDCGETAIIHRDSLNPDGSWRVPIGTGPFRFKEWRRGQDITLSRFEDYQSLPGKPDGLTGGKRPLVDELKFVFVPDPSTVKAAVASGALDAAAISQDDVAELSKARTLDVVTEVSSTRNAVLFQTDDKLFHDLRMRQAVEAALDIDQIVAIVSNGNATPNPSTIQARSPYYDAVQSKGVSYDPNRARQLLKAAGYAGQSITITTNNRKSLPSYNIAVVMQAMLQSAGINARIEIVDWGNHMDKFLSGKYQILVHSYSARFDPALSFEHFTGPKDTQARKVWDNPEATKLLVKASEISDPKERQILFDQLHEMMLADVPLIMLFNSTQSWAVSKKIHGFVPWEARARAWETTVDRN